MCGERLPVHETPTGTFTPPTQRLTLASPDTAARLLVGVGELVEILCLPLLRCLLRLCGLSRLGSAALAANNATGVLVVVAVGAHPVAGTGLLDAAVEIASIACSNNK